MRQNEINKICSCCQKCHRSHPILSLLRSSRRDAARFRSKPRGVSRQRGDLWVRLRRSVSFPKIASHVAQELWKRDHDALGLFSDIKFAAIYPVFFWVFFWSPLHLNCCFIFSFGSKLESGCESKKRGQTGMERRRLMDEDRGQTHLNRGKKKSKQFSQSLKNVNSSMFSFCLVYLLGFKGAGTKYSGLKHG